MFFSSLIIENYFLFLVSISAITHLPNRRAYTTNIRASAWLNSFSPLSQDSVPLANHIAWAHIMSLDSG